MDEKFEKIISESAHLFARYGIRNLSMDDICRDLGISKKTLYQYVENKADLIKAILSRLKHESLKAEHQQALAGMNAIDQLLTSSRIICANMKQFNPALTFELKKYYPAIFNEFYQAKKESIYHAIVTNIRQGIEEGLYRGDLDVELVARLYVQKLENIHDPDFLSTAGLSPDTVFNVMFDNHIRGISNSHGLAYYEKQLSNKNSNI